MAKNDGFIEEKNSTKKKSLSQQANEIIAKAEKKGVQTNFFFVTTLKRYQFQLKILKSLEKEIKASGATVTKEYVKGRGNVYTNPAIKEYNNTASAANNTVSTLIKIVESLPAADAEGAESLADKIGRLMDEKE